MATSDNTKAAYNNGYDLFCKFRSEFHPRNSWPPSLEELTNFVAFLSVKGYAVSTVKTYLAAISHKIKISTSELPDYTSHFIIRKMLEGMKRERHSKDTRLPITIQLLYKLINTLPIVCTSSYEASLFSAAFSLAFFGFLRVGEFTVGPRNSNTALLKNDLIIHESSSYLEVNLRRSKTDQYGKGTQLIIPAIGGPYCPLLLMQHYLQQRPNISGQLFCHFGGKPLTRYQFNSILTKCLSRLSISGCNYKSHSFRIGAATYFHSQGVDDEIIRLLGRWKSDCYRLYIRIPAVK
ncbi:uncharacterized protein LOC133193532 [Saccostrea echinata]|uniref:uncharacterized protein LOC133193532 n=1 Tax=Saccostrea echinata TaxID=191078 RepID=UPI002A7FD039|nr:uncharacterized protein LOC133193532 [Saccostrea echinata]